MVMLNKEGDYMSEKISFDEFKKIDMRIGTVKDVKDHPNADKLILLTVDLGSEERQLVAGLKKYYNKDELLGKQIVVLCNLEPAVFRGEKSEGMLLAAESGDVISILQPDKKIENGAKIR